MERKNTPEYLVWRIEQTRLRRARYKLWRDWKRCSSKSQPKGDDPVSQTERAYLKALTSAKFAALLAARKAESAHAQTAAAGPSADADGRNTGTRRTS